MKVYKRRNFVSILITEWLGKEIVLGGKIIFLNVYIIFQ